MKWDDGKEYPVVKVEVSSESHSVLHRQAEDRRHRRPRREVQAPLHQEDPGEEGLAGLPGDAPPPQPCRRRPRRSRSSRWRSRCPASPGTTCGRRTTPSASASCTTWPTSGDARSCRASPACPGCTTRRSTTGSPLAFGRLLQFVIEFHSAARLASGALVLAAFWLIYRRGARLGGPSEDRRVHGSAAMLLLLGSVGLIVHAHEALPELAALAALCGALAALPHARAPAAARPASLFGAALGFAALSASWIAPAALCLAVIAAHLVCAEWRTRSAVRLPRDRLVAGRARDRRELAARARLARAGAVRAVAARRLAAASAASARTCATSSSPAAGSPGRRGRSRCGRLWSLRRRWREPQLFVPALAIAAHARGLARLGAAAGRAPDPAARAARAARARRARWSCGAARRARSTGSACSASASSARWSGSATFAMLTGVPPRFANNFYKTAPGFAPEFKLLSVAVRARARRGCGSYLIVLHHALADAQRAALGGGHRAAVGHASRCC